MIKRITLILLLASGLRAATSWPLTVHLAETPDSIVAVHYYGSAIYDTVKSTTDSLVHTWEIQDDQLNQIVFNVYWSGYDSAAAWTFVRDPKTTYGTTEPWKLWGARWAEATDSVELRLFANGVQSGTTKTRGSTVRSYDTTVYVTAGNYNEVRLTLYYPSQQPAMWDWAWDLTDTVAGVTIGSGLIATGTIEGKLFLRNGLPAEGAVIQATAGPAINLAVGTGTKYILIGEPVQAQADSSGYFSLNLATTGSYADTTKGFYHITATYGGKSIFDIPDLWIGTGTINIADSLAGRTK